jgi:hypothetical protein
MKQSILLFAFIGFLSASSLAQTKASIGVKAGLSSASVRGDAANNLQNLLDFTNGKVTTNNS